MTRILSALFLFLAAPFAVADPPAHVVRIGTPKIVAIPSSAAPAPPAGAPVNLDSGKFLWLDVTGYDGNIEWDFSLPGSTVIPSDASAKYWGGVKQGESSPRWHSIPEGVIPFAGTTKIDPGKFAFVEVPDISKMKIGGTKQGDTVAKWYDPPSKNAVPLLGVKSGVTTVSAWGVVGERAKKVAEIVIAVSGESDNGEDQKPDDGKKDDSKPAVLKDVYIAIVKSANNLTPAQSNLLADVVFWNEFNVGKSEWGKYNFDDKIAQDKGYADIATKIQKPNEDFKAVMIVLDVSNGKKLYADFLPATKEEIRTAITKARK